MRALAAVAGGGGRVGGSHGCRGFFLACAVPATEDCDGKGGGAFGLTTPGTFVLETRGIRLVLARRAPSESLAGASSGSSQSACTSRVSRRGGAAGGGGSLPAGSSHEASTSIVSRRAIGSGVVRDFFDATPRAYQARGAHQKIDFRSFSPRLSIDWTVPFTRATFSSITASSSSGSPSKETGSPK